MDGLIDVLNRIEKILTLRVQKIVPVSNLKVGTNDLLVVNGPAGGASAIRATQIQLKYLWDKSDYLLQTGR